MSKRIIILLIVLAMLTTAATYFYTSTEKEKLSDPGLADVEREALVHGWPWGYYAEVTEVVLLGENQFSLMLYNTPRFKMFFQTCLFWFILWTALWVIVSYIQESNSP
jgi:hypothetical protein